MQSDAFCIPFQAMLVIQNVGSDKIILAKKWMCIVMVSLALPFLSVFLSSVIS